MIPQEIPYIFCVRTRWNWQNCSIITILKSRLKGAQNYGAGLIRYIRYKRGGSQKFFQRSLWMASYTVWVLGWFVKLRIEMYIFSTVIHFHKKTIQKKAGSQKKRIQLLYWRILVVVIYPNVTKVIFLSLMYLNSKKIC